MRTIRYTAAAVLPRILDQQGYKPSAIADHLGRSRGFVSLVVRGKRTIGEEDARKLSQFLRLPMDVIFVQKGEGSWPTSMT